MSLGLPGRDRIINSIHNFIPRIQFNFQWVIIHRIIVVQMDVLLSSPIVFIIQSHCRKRKQDHILRAASITKDTAARSVWGAFSSSGWAKREHWTQCHSIVLLFDNQICLMIQNNRTLTAVSQLKVGRKLAPPPPHEFMSLNFYPQHTSTLLRSSISLLAISGRDFMASHYTES